MIGSSVRCSAASNTTASQQRRSKRFHRTSSQHSHRVLRSPCTRIGTVSSFGLNEHPQHRFVAHQAQMSTVVNQGHAVLAALASSPVVWPVLGAVGTVALAVIYAYWEARRLTGPPKLTYQSTKFNDAVLSRMPSIRRPFKPLAGMTFGSGHLETIWAAKTRTRIDVTYRREVLHMPDGGIVSLDWRVPPKGEQALPDDAPVLILLPGLTGGSDDSYVRYAVHYAETHGTRAVVFNSRGCGDTFVTTPRYYSGLYIGDMQRVVHAVRLRHPRSLMFSAGWSLGANILTNYLGLVGEDTPLDAAAVMCNPFDLVLGSQKLKEGFNQVYSKNLGSGMSQLMRRNLKVWNGAGPEFDVATACNAPSVRAWDHAITRVSFGFKTVDDYYKAASSAQRVGDVAVPLLVIQAADDPIAPIAGTPTEALRDNPNCILAVTKTGGHLGWVSDVGGYFGEPWTDHILIEWLLSVQVQLSRDSATSLEGRNGSRIPAPVATPSYSKALPLSLQPPSPSGDLARATTPPLAVASSAGSSNHNGNGNGSIRYKGNGNGRTSISIATKGNGAFPPVSGAIYDPVSGLPVEHHDGVTLSPSQTGYFKPGSARGKLEDVYKGAATNGAAGKHGVSAPSVNGSGPPPPVVTELDVVAAGVQGGETASGPKGSSLGTEAPVQPARGGITTNGNTNGNGSAASGNSATEGVAEGLRTPVIDRSIRSVPVPVEGSEKAAPASNSGAGAVPAEPRSAVLGSPRHRSTAHDAQQRPSGASRGAPAEHQLRSFTMTGEGLQEVLPMSEDVSLESPPKLGNSSVAHAPRKHEVATGAQSERTNGGGAAKRGAHGGCGKVGQGSEGAWVNESPEQLAGAAAVLTMMCEAIAKARSSNWNGYGSESQLGGEWGGAGGGSPGRVGSVLRAEEREHMLAEFGQGVAAAVRQHSSEGVPAPVVDVDGEALSAGLAADDGPCDGSMTAGTGARAPVAAAVAQQGVNARSRQPMGARQAMWWNR